MDPAVFLPASTTYQQETEFITSDLFPSTVEASPGSVNAAFPQNDAFLTPQQYLFMPSGSSDFQPQDLPQDLNGGFACEYLENSSILIEI